MTYIIISLTLYLILVLLFWSLCAINKGSFAGIQNGTESAEAKKNVFRISSTALGNTKAYNIQSLYSKDFILPEAAGLKYEFRNPLPAFDERNIDYSASRDSSSRSAHVVDINAIEKRHSHARKGT
jgi:hypothetical protein